MDTPENSHPNASLPRVDPWEMQRELMRISNQNLPKAPELNVGVILYTALNLEEAQETQRALSAALERLSKDPSSGEHAQEFHRLACILDVVSNAMKASSLSIREAIRNLPPDLSLKLERKEVIEMADGTTDLAVTNSGLALSLGIDGAACYKEVVGSNISKKNPETGLIEKTPDGKWIKGRLYAAPDLQRVIYADEPKATASAEGDDPERSRAIPTDQRHKGSRP